MAFPVIASTANGQQDNTSSSYPTTLPSGIQSGDLLIMLFARLNATATTWPAGWAVLVTDSVNDYGFEARYRYATGSNPAPTLTTPAGATYVCWVSLRITGTDGVTAPTTTSIAAGTSTGPNSASLNPSTWGTEDTLWLSVMAAAGTPAPSAYPTNYTAGPLQTASTIGPILTYGSRGLNAASEDPGAFTLGTSRIWRAATLAVRPGIATFQGAAALNGIATFGAAGTRIQPVTATLGGAAGFAAGATVVKPSGATLMGAASLAATVSVTQATAITLSADAGLIVGAFLTRPVAVTLAGLAALSAAGIRIQPGAVTFAAVAQLQASGVPGSSAMMPADSTLTVAAFQAVSSAVAMMGMAEFAGPAWVSARATVAFPGVTDLNTVPTVTVAATLAGGSTFGATLIVAVAGVSLLVGEAALVMAAAVGARANTTLLGVAEFEVGSPFLVTGGTGAVMVGVATMTITAVIVPPPTGAIPTITFWALHPNGTYNVPLPDVVSWQLSPVTGSPGAVTLDYPAAGRNFDVLRNSVTADRDLEIAIWISGQDAGSLRALLNTSDGDDVAESAVWKFSGNFLNVRMEEAFVTPRTTVVTPPSGPMPTEDLAALRLYSVTAGAVMATLMQEAYSRGALSDIPYNFTSTVDSHGVPWSAITTLKIAPGTTYLQILTSLASAQMCEWEIIDRELVMWETGTRGTDHTLSADPLILRAGHTIRDSPRKHSVRDAGTTLLLAGAEGLYYELEDPTALARRGRRIERYDSQGSLTSPGSLAAYGQAQLPAVTSGVMEVDHGLAIEPGGPRPLVDYTIGDWVWSDTGHDLERLRIAQLTVSGDQSGIVSAGMSLNDLIADDLTRLSQRIDGIVGGSTITGTSHAAPAPDTLAPAAPQGVIVTSLAQPTADATQHAAVFLEWAEVTTNADSTAIDDLASYVVQWKYLNPTLTDNWRQDIPPVNTEYANWDDVTAGEDIEVRVMAVDSTGNQSAWSVSAFHTTETDSTPPPAPSTPTVASRLGVLLVGWDGLGSLGEPMPVDLDFVEVHVSMTSGFTPGVDTYYERISPGGGTVAVIDQPYGVTVFFRFVAVDKTTVTPNRSVPSTQASGVANQVVSNDIFDGAVGSLKLASAAVQTIHIDVAAINDAHIGSVSAGKITAGIMSAAVTLSGIIRTSSTGRRMEIDANGWRSYRTDGSTLFAELNLATESLLVTGTYQSGVTGERIRILPGGDFQLFQAAGSNYSLIQNVNNGIWMRGPLDGSGFSGHIQCTATDATLRFGNAVDTFNLAYVTIGGISVNTLAPFTGIRIDGRRGPSDRRFLLTQTNSGGTDVPGALLHYYLNSSGEGQWHWPNKNVSILASPANSNSLYVCRFDTAHQAPVTASAFVVGSSRAAKTRVRDIDTSDRDVFAAFRAAPTRKWRYKKPGDPVDDNNPDGPKVEDKRPTYPLLRRRPEVPDTASDDEKFETTHLRTGDWDEPEHLFPLAEDLRSVAPGLVQVNPDGSMGVDLRDMLGYQWDALSRIIQRLDTIETRLAANPRKP